MQQPAVLRFVGLGVFALLSAEGFTAGRYLDNIQGHQVQRVRPPLSYSLSQSLEPPPIGLNVLKPRPSPVTEHRHPHTKVEGGSVPAYSPSSWAP